MMRIAVVGAGGVGCFLGGKLALGGSHVVFLARGPQLHAIARHGLVLETPAGRTNCANVTAVSDAASAGPVDAVLFCVKAYDALHAARMVAPLLRPDTALVTLQNGLDSAARFRAAVPSSQPLPGSAYVSARVSAPGMVTSTGPMGSIVFGPEHGAPPANALRLLEACHASSLGAEIPASIRAALWMKFVLTASTAGLAAMGRMPNALIFRTPALRALAIAAMEECVAVAAAEGVGLPQDLIPQSLALADRFPPDMFASMCLDLLAGRRLELDVFSGAIVRLGQAHGIPVPVHALFTAALAPFAAPPDH